MIAMASVCRRRLRLHRTTESLKIPKMRPIIGEAVGTGHPTISSTQRLNQYQQNDEIKNKRKSKQNTVSYGAYGASPTRARTRGSVSAELTATLANCTEK